MDIWQIVQYIGFPAACLVVVGYFFWKGAVWFAKEFLVPIKDRHMKHLDEVSAGLTAQAHTLQNIDTHIEANAELMQEAVEALRTIRERQRDIMQAVGVPKPPPGEEQPKRLEGK